MFPRTCCVCIFPCPPIFSFAIFIHWMLISVTFRDNYRFLVYYYCTILLFSNFSSYHFGSDHRMLFLKKYMFYMQWNGLIWYFTPKIITAYIVAIVEKFILIPNSFNLSLLSFETFSISKMVCVPLSNDCKSCSIF